MTRRNLSIVSTGSSLHGERAKGVIPEHTRVRLSASLEVSGGRGTLPEGAIGTVVGTWSRGAAYEVEFSEPFHAVVTVPAPKLLREGR